MQGVELRDGLITLVPVVLDGSRWSGAFVVLVLLALVALVEEHEDDPEESDDGQGDKYCEDDSVEIGEIDKGSIRGRDRPFHDKVYTCILCAEYIQRSDQIRSSR